MPYCEPCQRYHAPSAMRTDGTCPQCGEAIEAEQAADHHDNESTPWHFKLLVGAVVVYLGWRLVQFVEFLL